MRTDNPFPWKSTPQYKKAQESNADFVLIMLGGNDFKKEGPEALKFNETKMIDEYLSLVNEMKDMSSKPDVRVMIYPQMYRSVSYTHLTLPTILLV